MCIFVCVCEKERKGTKVVMKIIVIDDKWKLDRGEKGDRRVVGSRGVLCSHAN